MTNLRETLRRLDGAAFGRTVLLLFLMAITMFALAVALIIGTSATWEDMWPFVLIGPAVGTVAVGAGTVAMTRRSGHNQEVPAGRRRGR